MVGKFFRLSVDWGCADKGFWEGIGGQVWKELERENALFGDINELVVDESQLARLEACDRRAYLVETLDALAVKALYGECQQGRDMLPRQLTRRLWIHPQGVSTFVIMEGSRIELSLAG